MADNPYLRVLGAQVRSQAQYRASFALDLVTATVLAAVDVGAIFMLFRVTKTLGGFAWTEIILITALSVVAFSFADGLVGEIERLKTYVRTGLLDTVLLRPLSALGQLLVLDFASRRLGRMLQALVFYGVALVVAPVVWTPGAVLLAVLAPIAGAVFFGSLFVVFASLAFWWVESGDVGNAFTYGGRDFTNYPTTMFGGWFRGLFAYGLGFAFVAYLPALALLGRSDPLGVPDPLRWLSPVVALLALLFARTVWRAGLRRYGSTGS
ncbi:ABC-2 family transporter protein [Longispora sp. NPDC051575]|uniref:ABC transporter permease n=1 Tax=Longispora sp. NPDC051575 TaxID=3154943 RepID=UPI00344A0460